MRVLALWPALLLGSQLIPASAQVSPPPTTSSAPSPSSVPAVPAAVFTLQDALSSLTDSAQYRQLQLALGVAQAQTQAARAATGITAGVNNTLGYSTSTTTGSNSVSTSLGVSGSLPVLPWAAASLAAQSAARAEAIARVTFTQAVAALTAAVDQAYGRAATAQLGVDIASNTLVLSQRQLIQVQAFEANRNATVQSVQAAQSAVQTAAVNVQSAQNELVSARRALGSLVGRDLGSSALTTDLSTVLAGSRLPEQGAALNAAQAFSPGLAGARKVVADAQVAVTSAERARRLPAATLKAGYGPGGAGLDASLNVQTGLLNLGYSQSLTSTASASLALSLNVNFNLLDPAADGMLSIAWLQLQQAQAAVTVQQTSLAQTLLDAYAAAQVAAQGLLPRQSSVTAYTTALATARARLLAGLATETEVLSAEITLAQASRDLTAAQVTALTSAAQLSALTGLNPSP